MRETVVGVDFSGAARASAQRRKILAIEATRLGRRRWQIARRGLNDRLLRSPPGWTAAELGDAMVAAARPSVVAADFPFSIPAALLGRESFARLAGAPRALRGWAAFNRVVAAAIALRCPVDYAPLGGWRDRRFWLRRATDLACGAQPALKDRFQVLFNMTLLGNAFLARLERSGRFDVVPFQARGRCAVIEVYPGHVLRSLGLRGYKRAPRQAIALVLRHLRDRGVDVRVDRAVRAVCEAYDTGGADGHDHDAADALVAACAGILYRERMAQGMGSGERSARARAVEGVIWSIPAAPRRAAAAAQGSRSPAYARGSSPCR